MKKRITRFTVMLAFLGVAWAGATLPIRAQELSPEVQWEREFPKSIRWYERTSSGVLLVRSGNELYGIDGFDGQELWSIKGLELGSKSPGRGHELLEIPGTPFFIAKKKGRVGKLRIFDIWDGHDYRVRLSAEYLVSLIPFYAEGNVLLIHAKQDSLRPHLKMMPFGRSTSLWDAEFPSFAHPFPEIFKLYPRAGWVYYYRYLGSNFSAGRFDPKSGEVDWKYKKSYFFEGRAQSAPLFAGDKVLLASRDIFALDRETGTEVWSLRDIDVVQDWQLAEEEGILYVVSRKGVWALGSDDGSVRWHFELEKSLKMPRIHDGSLFAITGKGKTVVAIDLASGEIRWTLETERRFETFTFRPESGAVLFFGGNEYLEVSGETGEVIRRGKLALKGRVVSVKPLVKDFVFLQVINRPRMLDYVSGRGFEEDPETEVHPAIKFMVYDLSTGERLGEKKFRGEQAGGNPFLVGYPGRSRIKLGTPFRKRLRESWPALAERAGEDETWLKILERADRVDGEDSRTFLVIDRKDEKMTELWEFDPLTEKPKQWLIPGLQVNLYPSLGIAFTVEKKKLRAFNIGNN